VRVRAPALARLLAADRNPEDARLDDALERGVEERELARRQSEGDGLTFTGLERDAPEALQQRIDRRGLRSVT
jgi:hypothetical protein